MNCREEFPFPNKNCSQITHWKLLFFWCNTSSARNLLGRHQGTAEPCLSLPGEEGKHRISHSHANICRQLFSLWWQQPLEVELLTGMLKSPTQLPDLFLQSRSSLGHWSSWGQQSKITPAHGQTVRRDGIPWKNGIILPLLSLHTLSGISLASHPALETPLSCSCPQSTPLISPDSFPQGKTSPPQACPIPPGHVHELSPKLYFAMSEKLVQTPQQEGPPQSRLFSAHPIITQPITFQQQQWVCISNNSQFLAHTMAELPATPQHKTLLSAWQWTSIWRCKIWMKPEQTEKLQLFTLD